MKTSTLDLAPGDVAVTNICNQITLVRIREVVRGKHLAGGLGFKIDPISDLPLHTPQSEYGYEWFLPWDTKYLVVIDGSV